MSLEISIKSNINNVNGIDYNAQQHATRVIADGGSVPNLTLLDKYVKLLKQVGVWNSLSECWVASAGVYLDENSFASKLYGLKALHDLAQATGTAQPVYSDGGLVFDGSNDFIAKTVTRAEVLALFNGGDFTFSWKGKLPQLANGVTNLLFSVNYDATNLFWIRVIGYTDNKLRFALSSATNAARINSFTPIKTAYNYSADDTLDLVVQYNNTTGKYTGFVNSIDIGLSDMVFGDINNISDANYVLSFSRIGASYTANTVYGCAFFKGILTPEQCKLEV